MRHNAGTCRVTQPGENLAHSWKTEENTDMVFKKVQADFVKVLLNCSDIKFCNYLAGCSSQANG